MFENTELMRYIVIALIGAIAAVLVNRNVAVFNDGLRPIMPEFIEGRMDRKALAATSFALSFGLVVGFGIPFSIGTNILLIHSVLLGTDIIGTWFPSSKKGFVFSGVVGALYGMGLVYGLELVVDIFKKLPVNFIPAMDAVGAPVITAFAAFPALVVAMQFGFKRGILTFVLTFLTRQFFAYYGNINLGATEVTLNADGMALLVGMSIMIFFAIRQKADPNESGANAALLSLFADRVAKIKKNIWFLAVSGGLIAAAASMLMMAGDPISLNLVKQGNLSAASMTSLARAISFIPLVATTAIVTGVYSPAGTKFVFVVGFLFPHHPLLAFIVGALTVMIEVYTLDLIAKALDKYPGMKAAGEHIRVAMNKVLEISLLVGGMMAADKIAPGLGFLFVAGIYTLNKYMKKPVDDMAVGPVAAILLGIIVNILYAVGLYVPGK